MARSTVFLYLVILVVWSTSWLPLSWQVEAVAPEIAVFWRFVLAAPLMWLFAWQRKAPLRVAMGQQIWFAALGLCLFSANFTLFYYGSLGVASGLLAVVFSTASLINLGLDALRTRTAPRPLLVLAALVGALGVGVLYWPEIQLGQAAMLSLLACLLGTLFFCSGNMVSAELQRRSVSVLTANCWGMLWGVVWLGLFGLFQGQDFTPPTSLAWLAGLVWLAVFASVVAFSTYLTLVGRIGPGRAGYATVVFPVFALFLSALFEGYDWSWLTVMGVGLVAAGNIVMLRSTRQPSTR
ncbi:MAG: DMT family transporter [Alphaproteobacteria bacterium]|nr:DMT family transporter [Alphaproteobacteria bacterium]